MARRKRLVASPTTPPPAPVITAVVPTVKAQLAGDCPVCHQPITEGSWCRVVTGWLVHPRCAS